MFEATSAELVAWSLAALLTALGIVVVVRRRRLPTDAAGGPVAGGCGDRRMVLLVAVVVPAVAFAVVAALMAAGRTLAWDLSVLHLAARHQVPLVIDAATGVTTLGALPVVIVLLVAVLTVFLTMRRYRQAAFVLAATLLALAAGGFGKVAFGRHRPDVFVSVHDWTFLTGNGGGDWSFPSGHTTAITALATSLVVVLWATRWRRPALIVALLVCAGVGVTRVYLGTHYPTDVLAGWALGVAAVLAVRLAFGDPAARGAQRSHARLSGGDQVESRS